MKKNIKVTVFLLVLLSVFVSLYFDISLIQGVSFLRNPVLNQVFLLVTFASSKVLIFLALTALFLWRENKRRWILPLWVSLGASSLVSFILKVTIQRLRPYQLNLISILPSLSEASHTIWNFSFPSSHAMIAFCAIPILSEQFPKFKKVWIAIAVLVSFSRVYLGLHFFSDIIAGALIGYVIGLLIVKSEKEHKFGKNIYHRIFGK